MSERPEVEASTTCSQCFGAGWVLEAKVNKEPTTLELIPCIYPLCPFSGRDVAVLCLYGEWGEPITHPTTGAVMSLKRIPNGRWTTPACSGSSGEHP